MAVAVPTALIISYMNFAVHTDRWNWWKSRRKLHRNERRRCVCTTRWRTHSASSVKWPVQPCPPHCPQTVSTTPTGWLQMGANSFHSDNLVLHHWRDPTKKIFVAHLCFSRQKENRQKFFVEIQWQPLVCLHRWLVDHWNRTFVFICAIFSTFIFAKYVPQVQLVQLQ